jgi:hypothetical protein
MRLANAIIALVSLSVIGCASVTQPGSDDSASAPTTPKTLLSWSRSEQSNDKDQDANGKDKDANGKDKANGAVNGEANANPPEQPAQEDSITTDRPSFTPSTRTVGTGHVQLETGYTFTTGRDGGITTINTHSYPEAELRIGMFANWFEFRLTQNFLSTASGGSSTTGATDLLIGTKLWLTEKDKFLPESSLIIQTTVPSSSEAFTSRKMLPGLILLYSWDLIPDRVSLSGSSQANAAVDPTSHSYLQLAQSLILGYTFNPKLGAFAEWYSLFPYGAVSGVTPQYNFDSGFTYKLTNNLQFDIRAGLGLTHTTNFFTGAGVSYRY